MEKKINIAELLKDCPIGMELYSPLFGDCKFVKVHDYESKIIVELETGATAAFQTDGRYFDYPNAECLLFPKGKTTWEGFQRPFKDGDIISGCGFIAIFHKLDEDHLYYRCWHHLKNNTFKAKIDYGIGYIEEYRYATEEEKDLLFKAIKNNGYKWNPKTKTLDEIPKIKDGDIIYTKTSLSEWVSIFEKFDDDECKCYIDYCVDSDTYCGKIGGKKNPLCDIDEIVEQRLATEEEKQKLFDVIKEHGHRWNIETKTLEKLIKPKFKVCVEFKEQDKYELFQNKFDINTFKPFKSKVLVRNDYGCRWVPAVFGCYVENAYIYKYTIIGGNSFAQCIPYEGNEHLLGITDDCDEFYKTWK